MSATHNAADITFAQQEDPPPPAGRRHGATRADHAVSVEVTQLAARIQEAQDPEIAQMLAFLTAWGTPAPRPPATWAAHHQGAVQMAQAGLADGHNSEANALAQKIITAQQGEITRMQNLLGSRSRARSQRDASRHTSASESHR